MLEMTAKKKNPIKRVMLMLVCRQSTKVRNLILGHQTSLGASRQLNDEEEDEAFFPDFLEKGS